MRPNAHEKQKDDDVVVDMDDAAAPRRTYIVSILFYGPCRVCKCDHVVLPATSAHTRGRWKAGELARSVYNACLATAGNLWALPLIGWLQGNVGAGYLSPAIYGILMHAASIWINLI